MLIAQAAARAAKQAAKQAAREATRAAAAAATPAAGGRKCGICRQPGHNRSVRSLKSRSWSRVVCVVLRRKLQRAFYRHRGFKFKKRFESNFQ